MSTVPSHARQTRRRAWPWVVCAIVVVPLALMALLAWDGWKLLGAADELEEHAGAAQQAVSDRDAALLSTEVVDMQAAADTFASHTTGVHWAVASWIPWVQDQTVPLQQAGASVRAVADHAL